jgi:hypothetical protein
MSISVFEDFIEAVDKLAARSGSSGSTTRVDGGGGIAEIATGATSGNWRQLETIKKYVGPQHTPSFGGTLRTKESANLEVFIGLADNEVGAASNAIGFYRSDSASAGNWKARVKAGGTGTDVDLGILGNTNDVEVLVVASPVEVSFFFNGRLVHSATTNIPTVLMHLALWIKTNTAAARTLAVDLAHLTGAR